MYNRCAFEFLRCEGMSSASYGDIVKPLYLEEVRDQLDQIISAINFIHGYAMTKGKSIEPILQYLSFLSDDLHVHDIYFIDDNLLNCMFFHFIVTALKNKEMFTGNVKVVHLGTMSCDGTELAAVESLKGILKDVVPEDALIYRAARKSTFVEVM